MSQHGGKLKLWRPLPKRIEDLLSITRLLDPFDSPLRASEDGEVVT